MQALLYLVYNYTVTCPFMLKERSYFYAGALQLLLMVFPLINPEKVKFEF